MNLKFCSFFLLNECEKMALFFHPSESPVGLQTILNASLQDGLEADRRLGWMKKQRHFFAFIKDKK